MYGIFNIVTGQDEYAVRTYARYTYMYTLQSESGIMQYDCVVLQMKFVVERTVSYFIQTI